MAARVRQMAILALAGAALLGTAGLADRLRSVQTRVAPAAAAGATVQVAAVGLGSIAEHVTLSGSVVARSEVELTAGTSERVQALLVHAGEQVRAGQLLATLDAGPAQAQLREAEAAVAEAQAHLSALEAGPSPASVAAAQAGYAAAGARYQQVVLGPIPAQVQQAQTAVQNALAVLAQAQKAALLAASPQGPAGVAVADAQQAVAAAGSGATPAGAAVQNAAQVGSAQVATAQTAANYAALLLATARAETCAAAHLPSDCTPPPPGSAGAPQTPTVAGATYQSYAQLYAGEVQAADAAATTQAQLTQAQAAAAADANGAQAQAAAVQSQGQDALAAAEAAQAQAEQQAAAAVTQAQAQVNAAEGALAALTAPATPLQLQEAKAAVDQAKAQLREAQQAVTPQDVAAARAALEQAQAAAASARLEVAATAVVAPISGTIAARLVSVGAFVTPQTPVYTLIGRTLRVEAAVPQTQLGALRPGDEVQLRALGGDQTYGGRVERILPTASTSNLTFEVDILPDAAGQAGLRAGEAVTAAVTTRQLHGVLLVPQSAVHHSGSTDSVFVVSGDRVTLRTIRTGSASGAFVHVRSGLSAGQEVVVAGGTYLAPGDRVRVAVGGKA